MEQAKEDSKESEKEVKVDLRLKLANAEQQLEKVRIRAGNAENNFRKVSKQVVEEKDLRAAADQRAGDLRLLSSSCRTWRGQKRRRMW